MRAILIVGTGRSGTSAVAGALHTMGLPFCDHLIGPHPEHNPLGHFECRVWWEMGRDVVEQGGITDADLAGYRRIIRNHRQEPLWAVKDTWLPEGMARVLPLMGEDVRVVAVHRQFTACIASREKHGAMPAADARREQIEREVRLFDFLAGVIAAGSAPVIHVDYERLVASTVDVIANLAVFVFEDALDHLSPQKLNDAVAFVDPALNHQGSSYGTY